MCAILMRWEKREERREKREEEESR